MSFLQKSKFSSTRVNRLWVIVCILLLNLLIFNPNPGLKNWNTTNQMADPEFDEFMNSMDPPKMIIPTKNNPFTDLPSVKTIQSPPQFKISSVAALNVYNISSPILITSNVNFNSTASSNGWTGNGTQFNPFIIENLNITSTLSIELIAIQNTDVFFEINDCLLDGGYKGIYMENVTQGLIYNNTITNFTNAGIDSLRSNNNTFSTNYIHNGGLFGINFRKTNQSSLLNNNITHSQYGIIFSMDCVNNSISNLIIENCYYRGVELIKSNFSDVSFISIVDCGSGMRISYSENCSLSEITIMNMSNYGCSLLYATSCNLTNFYMSEIADQGYKQEYSNSCIVNNITINNNQIGNYGFYCSDSHNCMISNIFVTNVRYRGFSISDGFNSSIQNINSSYSQLGILLRRINGSIISSCVSSHNTEDGVIIYASDNVEVSNIETWNNSDVGIEINLVRYSNISDCSSFNNSAYGIRIEYSHYCLLEFNYIFNNSNTGVMIWDSTHISIVSNLIFLNDQSGLILQNSFHSLVGNSIFYKNKYLGVLTEYWNENEKGNTNNTIWLNDFIANGWETTEFKQSNIYGATDDVSYNFWDTHTYPNIDMNIDYVDVPFLIGEYWGEESELYYYDDFPMSVPNVLIFTLHNHTLHYLTRPMLTYPVSHNASDPYYHEPVMLRGTSTIEWESSIDSAGDDITYSISIRSRNVMGEQNWTLAGEGITSSSYDWDTTSVYKGEFQIRIVASCPSGIRTNSIYQEIYIDNSPPVLSGFSSPGWSFLTIISIALVIFPYRRRNR